MDIRLGRPRDIDDLPALWRHAADGTSLTDDPAGIPRLLARDPEALILADLDARDRIPQRHDRAMGTSRARSPLPGPCDSLACAHAF